MAAPTHTNRVDPTPNGIALRDGFPTKVTVAADPDIEFWELTVDPPAIDGGDAIDVSTMFNVTWETKAPRSLLTLSEFTLTAAYDPDVIDQIKDVCNQETTITLTFPDGSQWSFFGFLRLFEPQTMEHGSQPECNVTITPTMWDPANNVEADYLFTEVAGT